MRMALLPLFVMGLAVPALAEPRVWGIDQSQTIPESLRLWAFGRAMKPQGIAFQALTLLPHEPWRGEPLRKFAQEFKATWAFRDGRGPADDLSPLLLSLPFRKLGLLGGP